MSAAGVVEELAVLADARAQFAAYEAVLVARFAALRPASADRREEEPGQCGGGLAAGGADGRGE